MPTSLDVYAPFDDGPGSNTMESTWRKFARYMLATGIIRTAGNRFNTFGDSSGMQVKTDTGECWVQGHYGESTSIKTLPIAAAHATLARLDRAVLRADFVNNRVEVDVLTGTAASTPVLPALTTNTSVWEVSLAKVSVAAGATGITASNVTDDRTRYVYTDYGSGALIDQIVLAASGPSVTFSNIPQTFRHLHLVMGTKCLSITGGRRVLARVNDDALGNYSIQSLAAAGTAVTGNRISPTDRMELGYSTPDNVVSQSSLDVLFSNYSRTGTGKTAIAQFGYLNDSGDIRSGNTACLWYGSSSPISKLLIYGENADFQAGSVFTLYGLG